MPRILRIINRLNLGGPTYNASLLTRHLAPDYETMLVTGARQDSEESSDFIVSGMGISFTEIPEMKREINPADDLKAYRRIRELIRKFRPHIVHTHAAKPGTLGRLAAHHEKVPVIVHTFHGHVFHSYFGSLKTQLFIGIERYLAKRSHAIIAISERQRDELVSTYRICPGEKVRIVPLGFDLQRFTEDKASKRSAFRSKYHIADDEIAIGIIGRLVPVKNHGLFIQCISTLAGTVGRKIKAVIIGDGEEWEHILQACRQAGLDTAYFPEEDREAKVMMTSWIHNADVAVAGLDIIVLTSLNEGTPVSLIEAQAGNKPVVSTRVGGVENVVSANTGILCESNDAGCLAAGLKMLAENDTMRLEMGSQGWEHVRKKYHYTRLVDDTRKVYEELLAEGRKMW